MSTNRMARGADYLDRQRKGPLPQGPNGRNLCRMCRQEVPAGRRRTFCSDECVREWNIRRDAAYARRLVWERDHGICAQCGIDTAVLEAAITDLYIASSPQRRQYRHRRKYVDTLYRFCQEHHLPVEGTCWHMDHIVPVIEGGGECGLDNLRTLCVLCHKRETAALSRRRAERKKGTHQCLAHS